MLARARDGEAFLVQKLLDPQNRFHVLAAVHALAGIALHRFQLRKFGFPKTQNVRRQMAEFRDLSNAEIKLVGDDDFARAERLGSGFCDVHVFRKIHVGTKQP